MEQVTTWPRSDLVWGRQKLTISSQQPTGKGQNGKGTAKPRPSSHP